MAQTPTGEHLFKVNPECKHLDAPSTMLFHHLVARLIFLTKQARPDILTVVAFLTTWVQFPKWEDYKKLAQVLNYLCTTHDLVLTLEASNPGVAEWWINGTFGNPSNMWSHTGGCLSLGRGMVTSKSTWQKLNTWSSTEAELFTVDDCLPKVLWTRLFLMSQGYSTGDTIIRQDNKSAMLLAENGNRSSSQQTRHLNV